MAHKNGNKYQIRIVREDGAEELSAWMHSIEEVAKAMILARKPQGTNCWLLVRSTAWPDCPDREQILEYPIMDTPSPRYIPHDSRFLQEVESRNRQALGFKESKYRP
jgi:hypothetical protein